MTAGRAVCPVCRERYADNGNGLRHNIGMYNHLRKHVKEGILKRAETIEEEKRAFWGYVYINPEKP